METVISEFVSPYYATNDPAHQIDHAHDVYNLAMKIDNDFDLGLNKKAIMIASLCHDMFANDREIHHEKITKYLIEDCNEWWWKFESAAFKYQVSQACYEHRASFEGEYSSLLSMLISSADRGYPNYKDLYNRAFYKRMHEGCNAGQAKDNALKHLKEKYGSGGYARYPDLYTSYFSHKLEQLRTIIDLQ